MLQRLLASVGSGVVTYFRCRVSEVRLIAEPSRIQFSLSTLFGAVTLATVVLVSVYHWHHWVLWNIQPYGGDTSEQWFIDARQHMFDWTTPILMGFTLVASFAIWYAIANREYYESLIGGLALSFPVMLPLGPLAILCVLVPLTAPMTGLWLLFQRRFLLGVFVILFGIGWLYFFTLYLNQWFDVFGD